MRREELDTQIVTRAAGVFERAADRLAEEVGDEYTATALSVALGAFVETRWGTGAVHQLLTNLAQDIEPLIRPGGDVQ